MGRKSREKYHLTLHQQAHQKLVSMQAFGESRAKDKLTGADRNRIYSFATYKTYRRAVMRFIKYVEHNHPESTTLKKAKKYANEWLSTRVDAGMSAWTVSMETSALCKLYGILPDDPKRFHAPQRRREDIKRSRGEAKRDKHFSTKNNDELIKFAIGTGARRNILEKLRGGDLWSKERVGARIAELENKEALSNEEERQLKNLKEALEAFPEFSFYLAHNQDKGGRYRVSPILPEYQDLIVSRMRSVAPDELVFRHIHSAADIHSYRGEYARRIYRRYERDLRTLPYNKYNRGTKKWYQGDVYICRSDEKGRRLDRMALYKTSLSLGHSRIDVVARNYLYGL